MFNSFVDGTYYSYFERFVAFILSLGVVAVILIASGHLAISLVDVYAQGFEAFDYTLFQGLFEQILTVLIALEFNHSLSQAAAGLHGIIQVRTIVLIAILAAVRKFIVIDIEKTDGVFLLGLGASVFALGAIYALMVWIDTREEAAQAASAPGQ